MGRFGGGVRPVMVVDGRSGQTSDLTTPGKSNRNKFYTPAPVNS